MSRKVIKTNTVTVPVNRTAPLKGVARGTARETATKIGAAGVQSNEAIAKVSIVGVGMRSHSGIASKMFETLSAEGVNIQMISTSEIKVSCVVDVKYTELAVRVLHSAFGLDSGSVKEEKL